MPRRASPIGKRRELSGDWSFESWGVLADSFFSDHGPPAFKSNSPLYQILNCLRVDDVLLSENARGQRIDRIIIEHRYGGLDQDRAGVQKFIDEVNGAASDFYTMIEGLTLCVEAWKGGEQGRVDVEHAIREGLHE